MKYIKKSDVKVTGARPLNALHYEDYAVFSSVEEYKQFNLYPTKAELKSKEDELYADYVARAHMGDGYTKDMAEPEFAKLCKREAEKYFDDVRNQARKQIAKDATKTNKAFLVLHDMMYKNGEILTTCVAAFDNADAVKEFLAANDKTDYVVDQDGKRIFGKTLEERQNEQTNQNDGLQA
jgi:hypothetical protein